jgi:transposase
MRGKIKGQPDFLTVVNLESRVPPNHPLRGVKKRVDEVLRRMNPQFEASYGGVGRPSIPPEQLLKSWILMALFSVRSERLFCDQLGYNLLWQWFLDRDLEEGSFDHSVFSKNKERLFSTEVSARFFAEVYGISREEGWASDDHFSADGSLIEAWASTKSFRRKDGSGQGDDEGGGDGNAFKSSNPEVDFKGEKRSNETHCSRTDPESVLYRKGPGKEAKLCFGAHALMENRNGLLAAIGIHNPIQSSEADMALDQMEALAVAEQGLAVTLGGDKGYHNKAFVGECRDRGVKPHVACVRNRTTPGLDGRTTSSAGYKTSQRIRKRIEEIFGWMKTVGLFRKTRYRGIERTQTWVNFLGATYNLVRMANLEHRALAA